MTNSILMSKYTADEVRLKELATDQDKVWHEFYEEMRSPFRLYFLKYTKSDMEAVNILFQDAMVVVHRKITNGGLQAPLRSTLKVYLIGVGKILYRKQYNKQMQWTDDMPDLPVEAVAYDKMVQEERIAWVQSLLKQLGEKCQEVLSKVYLKSFSMDAVAKSMGLPTANAARKRKFDCLKKMQELVK